MNSLFNGTIYFASIEFTVQNQGNKVISVSDADMNTAISYATQAAVPISLYAAQYGQASITISQNPCPSSKLRALVESATCRTARSNVLR